MVLRPSDVRVVVADQERLARLGEQARREEEADAAQGSRPSATTAPEGVQRVVVNYLQGNRASKEELGPQQSGPSDRQQDRDCRANPVSDSPGRKRKEANCRRTGSLVRVDGAALVIANDPPDRDAESGQERKHGRHERVQHEPAEAGPHRRALRARDDLVDVEVRCALFVAAEAGGQRQAQERDTLIGSGKDPGLQGAAGRREAGRPGPEELVQLVEGDHDEGGLQEVVQVGQARRENEDLFRER